MLEELSFDELVAQIQSSDPISKSDAIEELGLRDDPRALPILIDLLRQNHTTPLFYRGMIYETIVYALRETVLGLGEAPRQLMDLLSDPDPKIRISAAYGLGEKAQVEGISALLDIIRFPISGSKTEYEHVVESLWRIGDDALPSLYDALDDDDLMVRLACLEAIARIGNPESLDKVKSLLKTTSLQEREAVIEHLVHWEM
jgi:HEAT repeat protein